MDTNYNSITLFWGWVFGTLQPLRDDEPVQYGITRPVRADRFWDVQFGEFRALWRDVRQAPGILNKSAYLLMQPGWSHTGQHQTVSLQKRALRSILELVSKSSVERRMTDLSRSKEVIERMSTNGR